MLVQTGIIYLNYLAENSWLPCETEVQPNVKQMEIIACIAAWEIESKTSNNRGYVNLQDEIKRGNFQNHKTSKEN